MVACKQTQTDDSQIEDLQNNDLNTVDIDYGDLNESDLPEPIIFSEEEAIRIISSDENWDEFMEIYPDFDPVLINQYQLNVNTFEELLVLWEGDARLSNLIQFLDRHDFSGQNYLFEFTDREDNKCGLISIIDANKEKSLFIAAVNIVEVN